MSLSAKEMLDGHHQRVNTSAHARTADNGLLQKRLEEISAKSCHVPPLPSPSIPNQSTVQGLKVYMQNQTAIFLTEATLAVTNALAMLEHIPPCTIFHELQATAHDDMLPAKVFS